MIRGLVTKVMNLSCDYSYIPHIHVLEPKDSCIKEEEKSAHSMDMIGSSFLLYV